MIASWMLYCSLCGLGLSAAAALAERALLRGRAAVRVVWIAAVLLSLLVPALALRFAPRPITVDLAATGSGEALGIQSATELTPPAAANRSTQTTATRPANWRAIVARWDEELIVAWITLSAAVAFNFFGGILVLAWMRRRWQRHTVMGVPVYISERTGPAVVGAFSPAIVVPQWVLALEPAQLALMLRHEQEHREAGDGRLLTIAQLALIAMPWNPALWWQIFRLRVAVELDCDARVLREADARSYGDLLLEFARPRRGPSLLGATAFAERAAQLERRIRLLARHRVRTSAAARAVATCIGVVALTGAWVAPRPAVPGRAPIAPTPQTRTVQPPLTVPPISNPVVSKAPEKSPTQPVSKRVSAAAAPRITAPPCGGAAGRANARLADTIFDRLFEGITLSAIQAEKVCALLARLEKQQAVEDETANARQLASQARALSLRVQRDSALRALLTNDADRIRFDEHVAQAPAGGRGRGGGAGADPAASGRRGGGGGVDSTRLFGRTGEPGARGSGGGGRGGRGGATVYMLDSLALNMTNMVVDLNLRRLFEGITLTPEQEASARAILAQSQQEIRQQNRPGPPVLRIDRRNGLVSMSDANAAELSALLSNEADKQTLQARIVAFPAR
jgi:beta-lactamase regulating signal transducer with metallopeptidase domain